MKIFIPEGGDDDVDLTPMIDIVFLLIVFFMTVASLLTAEKIPVKIPVAENSKIPKDAGSRQLITIKSDGELFAGIRKVSHAELTEIVREGNETLTGFQVFLRADKNTPHRIVREAMIACAEGGSFDIIFAVYQSGK